MKVSICIPAYKHVDFLKRCLGSVFEQEFSDFEVIITDDSPDNVLGEFVNTYSDERIHYFKNEKVLGSPLNWNEGLKKAKGEYIKILHHDDWFASPQSLGIFVSLLDENPNADIAFSGSCSIAENNQKHIHIADKSFLRNVMKQPETIYLRNAFGAPSVCIFRNHKNFFFEPSLIWLVDTDFYIRVIAKSSFVFTPQILLNIGVSEFQITQQCLTEFRIRLTEKIRLFRKFDMEYKSSRYRRSLLRALGREGIWRNADLKEILPDIDFSLSTYDSLWAYYFHIRKKVWDTYVKLNHKGRQV